MANAFGTSLTRREWLGVLGSAGASGLLQGCATGGSAGSAGFAEVVRRAAPAVVGVADDRGVVGSGFRLGAGSRFVTAAHLVASPRGAVSVVGQQGRWPARVLRADAELDLAVLECGAEPPMPGLSLRTDTLPAVGDWIVVLGCPFGGKVTATVGIVSAEPGAVREPAALRTRLQLNAAVNPGNSGGPAVDLAGRVVGVVSAALPAGAGLGFAVPAPALADFLRGLAG